MLDIWLLYARVIQFRRRNVTCGRGTRIEPSLLARGGPITIGPKCIVRFGSVLMPASGRISVGDETSINHYCILHGQNGLSIGRSCRIAPRVAIYAANHEFRDRERTIASQGMSSKGGVRIGDDVWIGTGVIILDGVSIGTGAVIGAGAIVTKDIPSYSIAVGNPARVIGSR